MKHECSGVYVHVSSAVQQHYWSKNQHGLPGRAECRWGETIQKQKYKRVQHECQLQLIIEKYSRVQVRTARPFLLRTARPGTTEYLVPGTAVDLSVSFVSTEVVILFPL